jgi:hypothetical protein
MADLSDREHTELMMLWKNAAKDIEYAKREQWSHFYAVLLGQVGVAGFSQFEFSPPWHLQPNRVIFSALAILLGIGILVLVLHQVRLLRLRRLIKILYEKGLEQHSQGLLGTKEADSVHRIITPFLMFLVLVIAFIFFVIVSMPDGSIEQSFLLLPS